MDNKRSRRFFEARRQKIQKIEVRSEFRRLLCPVCGAPCFTYPDSPLLLMELRIEKHGCMIQYFHQEHLCKKFFVPLPDEELGALVMGFHRKANKKLISDFRSETIRQDYVNRNYAAEVTPAKKMLTNEVK